MQNEKVKAWVTRDCPSVGIVEVEGFVCDGDYMICPLVAPPLNGNTYYHRGDWHRTPEAAIARAEEMRAAKIDLLERQIERLMKLEFKV